MQAQDTSYNQQPSSFQQDDSLDLKKYLYMMMANWYWFLISLTLSLSIAYMVTRYTKPVYRVSSSLMIQEDERGRGLSSYENLIPGMEIFRNQKKVLNELEILRSYSLASKTLDELDFGITYVGVGRSGIKEAYLYKASPFYVELDTLPNVTGHPVYVNPLDHQYYMLTIDETFDIRKKVAFGQKVDTMGFHFTVHLLNPESFDSKATYNKYYFIINNKHALTNQYKAKISIETNDEKRGSVLFLSVNGFSPDQEVAYLNKLMEVYIRQGLEEKNLTAVNTVNFIDSQLGILNDSLKVAEIDLQNFRLKNQVMDLTQESTLIFEKLEKLQEEAAMLNLQARYFSYLKEYVNNRNNLNEVVGPSTVNIVDPLLNSMITNLNELIAEKNEVYFSVQEGNPSLTMIDFKIDGARKALLDNINNLIHNNTIAINELNKQLSEAENQLSRLPVTQRQYISIQRQYKVNDQIYTYLLQKRAEAAIARASNVADNKILDYARGENAELISPKKKMNYMIGLLLGLFTPFGILILLDLFNNKISGRNDIEKRTLVPIVGSIGHSAVSGDIPVIDNPKSALSESFRGLRTNLQYLLRDKEQKVITITSTISGEGKTFCSVNLAAIFALAGKKTLLVGLDLRKPKIHRLFNLKNDVGVSTCLIGKTQFRDVIFETKITNLYIAPAGPIPPNPAELLEQQDMDRLLDEARKEFDYIILDTPPFGMVTDALLLARRSDASLFLVRQNYSNRAVLEFFEEIRQKRDIHGMGIILNDISHKGYYGYGYRYYNYEYGYRYGYYYTYGKYDQEDE
ncbi:MAG: GumC family protein [Bacteroidota bacterium]